MSLKRILILLMLIFIIGISSLQSAADRDRSMYRSSLRDYRLQHYRERPVWWDKYEHKQANFIYVSFSKNKKLIMETYEIVVNNNKRGARFYNAGLAQYRAGARLVHQGGQWRRAINLGLLSRRNFYLAQRVNGVYSGRVLGENEFITLEFEKDNKDNEKDLAARRDSARRRLTGETQQEIPNFQIDLDSNVDIQE